MHNNAEHATTATLMMDFKPDVLIVKNHVRQRLDPVLNALEHVVEVSMSRLTSLSVAKHPEEPNLPVSPRRSTERRTRATAPTSRSSWRTWRPFKRL